MTDLTPPPMSEEDIDLITADGMRNAVGGIYAGSVTEFARAIEAHVNEQWRQRLEQVAWTLQSELDAKETTCRAHLWFEDPQSYAWTPLYRIKEQG